MRFVPWLLVLSILLPAAAWARDDTAEPPGVSERIAAIQEEYQKAQQEFFEKYQKLETDEERSKYVQEAYPKPDEYADRILAVVDANPDSPEIADGLVWVAQNARSNEAKEQAIDTLLARFIDHESLGDLCMSLAYSQIQGAEGMLREIHEQSPHREVKGQALFALAQKKNSREVHKTNDRESLAEAEGLFATLMADYGDLPYRGDKTLADAAKGALHEIRNLTIGKPAPEIEGEDIDGVAFKLSDYRGKVVFLDFWGHW